jgi:molecular chaperone DnaJ
LETFAKTHTRTCYYKLLGVPVRASKDEIRRAFRLLALRLHPDRNPGDPGSAERFREVLKAYETLIDPATRGRYDRIRGYRKSRRKAEDLVFDAPEREYRPPTFDEIFQETFGFARARVRKQHGADLRFDLQVARSQLAAGAHEEINYQRLVFCRNCIGNGGRRAAAHCESCRGMGEIEESCSLKIWIPPGSQDGARVRVQGAGDFPYPGSPPGDLVVLVHVIEGQ